jgi:hypothetical protein
VAAATVAPIRADFPVVRLVQPEKSHNFHAAERHFLHGWQRS